MARDTANVGGTMKKLWHRIRDCFQFCIAGIGAP